MNLNNFMLATIRDGDRIEVEGIPSSMLEFWRVDKISESAIPLNKWPEGIYCGREIAGFNERVSLEDLPPLNERRGDWR